MKKALGLAGKYVIMFLSCLFPRSRKIYIFGAWLGEQFADNPKYLFLEAQEHKEIVRYGSRRMNQSAEKSGSLDMKLICLTVSKEF